MTSSPQHFDEQSTSWTLLHEAHHGEGKERSRAQAELIRRYDPVVRRYLAGALRSALDLPAVDELVQQCWTRLVEGRFQAVNPAQGRFRDYLRRVLSNLVTTHLRARSRAPVGLGALDPPAPEPVSDEQYLDLCRAALLERALEQLLRQDQQKNQGFFTVLQALRDYPEASMEELAGRLSVGGPARTVGWVRTTLFRARQRLGELLRLEVAQEPDVPTSVAVDEELGELGLLAYC